MPLKESEAKFKYCPLLKTHDDKLKFCQASMCMMWRIDPAEADKGFCGLAGAPLALVMAKAPERRREEKPD